MGLRARLRRVVAVDLEGLDAFAARRCSCGGGCGAHREKAGVGGTVGGAAEHLVWAKIESLGRRARKS